MTSSFICPRRVAAFLLLLFAFCAPAQHHLEFTGTVTDTNGRPVAQAVLQVYDSKGEMVRHVTTKGDGAYEFKLSTMTPDRFTVFVKLKGHVTKKFLVSTENIPKEQRGTKFPRIEAYPSLFREVPGVDYSALEEPIVYYYYDPARDVYVIDQEKLARMRLVLAHIKEQERQHTK